MSTRFKTLLLREWIQHHRGWLIAMFAPPVFLLLMLAMPFSTIDFGPLPAVGAFVAATIGVTIIVLGVAAVSVLFQAPGLARRDRQDRSIEFWLSLPTGHSASIGATLLMHLLFVPLLALLVGAVASQVIGLAVLARVFGVASWLQLPWASVAAADVAALLRAALGVVLACFWLSPIVLLTMAASAWLKRWGLPVLVLVLGFAHLLLKLRYGITVVNDTFNSFLYNAGRAMIHHAENRDGPVDTAEVTYWIESAPRWLLHDGLSSLGDLAQPVAVVALVISALCFWLLVLRRQRND